MLAPVQAISTHCDTRWCILHTMVEDVLNSKDAIKSMLADAAWTDILASATNADEATDGMEGHLWWTKLRYVYELGKPIAEAITQIQTDMPKLSAVLPMWLDLLEHAKAWTERVKANPSVGGLYIGTSPVNQHLAAKPARLAQVHP